VSTDAREIRPLERPPNATVEVPGSKSITNRAVLLAALAEGRSELSGALFSDDTRYMVAALRALGVAVEADEAAARLTIEGCGGRWPVQDADLFVGNAGTAMRFLVAALCLGHGRYRIDGTARMRERPIGELVDALRRLGADVDAPGGTPPVSVRGGLSGGRTDLSAAKSSQFVSAVLQVAPYAERDVTIELVGDVIAQPYIDMTHAMMSQWGVRVAAESARKFHVVAGQRYRAQRYTIEPDASSAHYFWAAAALTGGHVGVRGIADGSLQGDVRFVHLLHDLGMADYCQDGDALSVSGWSFQLEGGFDADMNAFSDTVPTLAVLAAFATQPVHIFNVRHLRWQESDRLHAIVTELQKLGGKVEELEDGMVIHPSTLHGGTVQTYDDHRIAMAFALVGLKVPGIRIENPGCVAKTFPDFFEKLECLRQ